jgi:hypothetical protein
MRRGLLALLAVLAGLLLSATAVYASGKFTHFPPDMHAGTQSTYQHARLAAMEWRWWSTYEDRWITGRYLVEPTDAGWPAARLVGKNEVVQLIIDSPVEPDKVFLKSYRNPELTGDGKVLNPGMYPVREHGRHGKVLKWVALFKVERAGQHYVTAFVRWDQTPGRHYSYGWERRQVHLRTR